MAWSIPESIPHSFGGGNQRPDFQERKRILADEMVVLQLAMFARLGPQTKKTTQLLVVLRQ